MDDSERYLAGNSGSPVSIGKHCCPGTSAYNQYSHHAFYCITVQDLQIQDPYVIDTKQFIVLLDLLSLSLQFTVMKALREKRYSPLNRTPVNVCIEPL